MPDVSTDQTRIHYNYFANRQTTTNRYIDHGDQRWIFIFENKIEPIIGSVSAVSGHIHVLQSNEISTPANL